MPRRTLPLTLLLSFLFPGVAPAENSRDITVLHPLPLGGTILFTYSQHNQSNIWRIDTRNLPAAEPVLTTNTSNEYPRCSPDGKQFAYYSRQKSNSDLFLASIGGKMLRPLSTTPGEDEDPSWSPDGRSLVFQSQRQGQGRNLFRYDFESRKLTPLTTGKSSHTTPAWSPGGRLIAYSTSEYWPGWDVAILDVSSKAISRITYGLATSCRPTWTSDSKFLIFSKGFGNTTQLVRHSLETHEEIELTRGPGRKYDALLLGSSEILLYVAESSPGRGDFELFWLDTKHSDSKPQQLTQSSGAIRYPTWCVQTSSAIDS